MDAGGEGAETAIDSAEAFEGEDGVLEVPVEAGRYRVEANTFEQSYEIVVEVQGGEEPCTQAPINGPGEGPGKQPGDPEDSLPPGKKPPGFVEGTDPKEPLPRTGGISTFLGAGALLVASAALFVRVLRP